MGHRTLRIGIAPRTVLVVAVALTLNACGDDEASRNAGSAAARDTIASVGFEPARPSKVTARMRLGLTLRDATVTRRSGGLVLTATPAGRGRLVTTAPSKGQIRRDARSLAFALDGLSGRTTIAATIGGRRMRLRAPRIRGGRLVATVVGGRPGRLGDVRLRATITRPAHRRANCTLLPFASCARAQLALADMLHGDVRGIDLRRANLHRAYAHGAKLAAADLRGADLRGADLTNADLRRADLRGANLADAHLAFARLGGARLDGARLCRTQMPGKRARTTRDCDDDPPKVTGKLGSRTVAALPAPAGTAPRRRVGASPAASRGAAAVDNDDEDGGKIPADPTDLVMTGDGIYCGFIHYDTVDSDKDGLSDCYERTARTLSVTSPDELNNDGKARQVTGVKSDDTKPDTDGDGLRDGAEYKLGSNPSSSDTDNDGLNDDIELTVFDSNIAHADSDGDSGAEGAAHDRRLYDGQEVKQKTSPVVSDTDGDTLTDLAEIVNQGSAAGPFRPRVADLPRYSVDVDPDVPKVGIQVHYTTKVGSSTENREARTTLTSTEHTETHELSVELGFKFGQKFEAEAKAGIPLNQASTKITLSAEQSIKLGTTNTWEDTTSTEDEYAKEQADESSKETELEAQGCVQALLKISNPTDIGFRLESPIQVIAEIPSPDDPESSVVLTTMQPIDGGSTDLGGPCPQAGKTEVQLPPRSAKSVAFVGAASSEELLDFMAEPVPITFKPGNVKVVDELDSATNAPKQNPVNFEKILENVGSRTATIIVDRGRCLPDEEGCDPADRVDSHAVATARTGKQAGITLDEALDALQLKRDYAGGSSNREKLVSVGGQTDDSKNSNRGLWTIIGSDELRSGQPTGIGDDAVDDPDIRLGAGNFVLLTYHRDSDDDGVLDSLENANGTDLLADDTDKDGLSDKLETTTGWTVPLPDREAAKPKANYRVFSSPLSCDADGDGSPDGPGDGTEDDPCPKDKDGKKRPPEATRGISLLDSPDKLTTGTDPKRPDTNFDGELDGVEPYPRVLQNVPPGARQPAYVTKFGSTGQGGGSFDKPTALAVDRFNGAKTSDTVAPTAWVSDPLNGLVQGFGLAKTPFTHFGNLDVGAIAPQNTKLVRVGGVVVSPQSTTDGGVQGQLIYAAGFAQLSLAGIREQLAAMRAFNSATGKPVGDVISLPSELRVNLPDGADMHLAVDPSANVYVATTAGINANGFPVDESFASVRKYDKGRQTQASGAFAGVTRPTGIAVDASGSVFVSQDANGQNSVTKFDDSGLRTVAKFGATGAPGVAVDGDGYVYVPSPDHGIFKLSNDLTLLTRFGAPGSPAGALAGPVDVAFDVENDVYVLDAGSNTVKVYAYPYGEDK